MADIEKVRVGDELLVRFRVVRINRDPDEIQVSTATDSYRFFGPKTIEAAEHIPAPRVFRRGDKVFSPPRYGYGLHGRLNGLVLGVDPTHEDRTLVHWEDQPWMGPAVWQMKIGGIDSVLTEQLEHDEAPE